MLFYITAILNLFYAKIIAIHCYIVLHLFTAKNNNNYIVFFSLTISSLIRLTVCSHDFLNSSKTGGIRSV